MQLCMTEPIIVGKRDRAHPACMLAGKSAALVVIAPAGGALAGLVGDAESGVIVCAGDVFGGADVKI